MNNIITEELMPALEGAIPGIIATASATGIPNATYIWQVFYVDEYHVALSRQFFKKTLDNIMENPQACVLVTSPVSYQMYKLYLQFVESQTQGPVFEKMALQMEVIAGMQRGIDTFDLLAADIYKVIRIERIQLS
ncbi:MAG TPA: pyridoxamine 5'-phosphate oxidase family protein [Flavisolibacter sp.]|nr:pyridoxamine 5'-phosphate oxidase family protein [Flavisolibacter sp.]